MQNGTRSPRRRHLVGEDAGTPFVTASVAGFGGAAIPRARAATAPPAEVAGSTKSPSHLRTIYSVEGTKFNANYQQVQQALDAQNLDVNGSGVKVGVLSDSFNAKGGAGTDEAEGLLPPVHVLNDNHARSATDEGRAMLQVVHDVAPGTSLDFATPNRPGNSISYDQKFANAILALARDGCKIICDDISVTDEPFFQGSVIDRAIRTVEQQGVIYLTAAGNNRSAASQTSTRVSDVGYQSAWRRTTVSLSYNGKVKTFTDALAFSGGSAFQTITIQPGNKAQLRLQWNQPWGHATSNLALIISQNGQVLYDGSTRSYAVYTRSQNGYFAGVDYTRDPLVDMRTGRGLTTLTNQTGYAVQYQVSIVNMAGPDPNVVKYINYADAQAGGVVIRGENAGTAVGHAESPDAIAVGAVDTGNTPAFGNSPPLNEFFSSGGRGAVWYYDINGVALRTPQRLRVVDVCGVDDIATSLGGNLGDFFGTSCAAPSVAGVVALMIQKNPSLTEPDVQKLLADTAVPMINPVVSGAGLADAARAVAAAANLHETSRGANTLLMGTHLDDVLRATGTNNVLVGGAGRDTYVVNDASDQVVETAGEGTDTVRASVSYSIARDGAVENLRLFGPNAIDGTGNALANVIRGDGRANTITGGRGDDTLTGGGGGDLFVYHAGWGHDVIRDFDAGSGAGHDRVQFDRTLFANAADVMAHVTDGADGAVLSLGGHDSITFDGVTRHALTRGDFRFV